MAYVSYISRQHLDVNGIPIDGGKIYSYLSGTTDGINTFVDKECTRMHEWPIVLDVRGNCEVYVADERPVRYELYDAAGEHVETWDAIPFDETDLSDYAKKEYVTTAVASEATLRVAGDENNAAAIRANAEAIESHISDKDNPHEVTAEQVGAYTKEQVDAEIKKESDARELYDAQLREAIEALEEKADGYVTGEEVSEAIAAEADARIQEDIALNARIDTIPQTDWNETDEGSMAYLANHPQPISDVDIEALFS